MTRLVAPLALLAFALLVPVGTAAPDKAVEATQGMVVAVSPPAVDIGVEVLQGGGNAVDAAVAVAFAMAVTYPAAGNIGGGGFMMVHPGGGAEPACVEYRETAPAAAKADMYAKIADEDWYSAKFVGIPGTVRGLALAHQRFGSRPWKELLAPAVKLAGEGFTLDGTAAGMLNGIVGQVDEGSELRRALGKDGGKGDWQAGDRMTQPDLARTLRLIQEQGPDAFYTGPVADRIAAEMKAGGGLITKADLAAYKANVRKPVHGTYRGYDVYGPPPPSSGGTGLVEMLNVLENFDLAKHPRYAPETVHLLAETMRRAYRDRARYLGDADFVEVPAFLTAKDYARTVAKSIDPTKATPSASLAGDIPISREGDSTTHFSVIDKNGMAVASTYTLERSFGSRIVVRGAGFVLNNEMMDFNPRPGVTDRSGHIGTDANQITPGKRMLSSQTPTIVAKDGKVRLVTGSPGSRTIINTSLQVVVNVIDFGMDIQAAVDAPRQHHAWLPDELRLENAREPAMAEAVKRLQEMGHKIVGTRQGDAHSIFVDPKTGRYYGAADHRIIGKAAGY
jgi:gamma-glutamyltranspeptidase/glutathione hydrolase